MRLLEKSKRLMYCLILLVVSIFIMFYLVTTMDSARAEIKGNAHLTRAYIGSGFYDIDDNDKFYMTMDDYVEAKMNSRYIICAVDGILMVIFGVVTLIEGRKVSLFISKQAELEEQAEKEKLAQKEN